MTEVTNTTEEALRDPGLMLAKAAIFGSSRSIEMQERQGQQELVASSVLPADSISRDGWEILERWGVHVLGAVDGDPMFRRVLLPEGWRVKATDHAMWTKLRDERDRERASIFYKAAFYDRSAHFTLEHAVKVGREWGAGPYSYFVKVAGEEVFRGPTIEEKVEGETHREREDRDRAARAPADAFVAEHYPNHEDFTAYWD